LKASVCSLSKADPSFSSTPWFFFIATDMSLFFFTRMCEIFAHYFFAPSPISLHVRAIRSVAYGPPFVTSPLHLQFEVYIFDSPPPERSHFFHILPFPPGRPFPPEKAAIVLLSLRAPPLLRMVIAEMKRGYLTQIFCRTELCLPGVLPQWLSRNTVALSHPPDVPSPIVVLPLSYPRDSCPTSERSTMAPSLSSASPLPMPPMPSPLL